MRSITLSDLSTYRSAVMGAAMLCIFFFHCSEAACFGLPVLRVAHYGYSCVDVFMLLSGYGLCYGFYRRGESAGSFLRRRLWRILPTFWLVAAGMHLCSMTVLHFAPQLSRLLSYPHTLPQTLGYYTTLGWWLHPKQHSVWFYDWYVPTILLCYALFPVLARLGRNARRAAILLGASVAFSLLCIWLYVALGGESLIYMSFTRLPSFVLGVLLYHLQSQHGGRRALVAMIVAVPLMLAVYSDIPANVYNKFVAFAANMIFIQFAVTGKSLLMSLPCRLEIVERVLSYLGTRSLEIYLTHQPVIAVVRYCGRWDWDWPLVAVALIVTLFVAEAVHRAVAAFYRFSGGVTAGTAS